MNALTSPTPTAEPESDRLSRSEIFDVLSNHRRVCVLRYLTETERDVVAFRDVVDYVAGCEVSGPIEQVDYQTRKSVYTALRQTHLPKLDELGAVEFDRSRGELQLTEKGNRVRLYLEYVPENDIPWHTYYLGLAALSGFLLTATALEFYPFGIEWQQLAVLLFVLFGVSAVVHTVHSRKNVLGSAHLEPVEESPANSN